VSGTFDLVFRLSGVPATYMERLRPLGFLAICISVIFFYAILLMTVGSSLTSALIIRAPVFSEGLAKN